MQCAIIMKYSCVSFLHVLLFEVYMFGGCVLACQVSKVRVQAV